MPSITTWTRLESDIAPSTHAYDADARQRLLMVGQQARIHDPLWLLGRQWQFGELRGEDAGSPVRAQVRLETTPITAFAPTVPAPGSHIAGQPYPRDPASKAPLVPLEALVERERVRSDDAPSLRLAAEAGLHLVRLLVAAGLPQYRTGFVTGYPLAPASDLDPESAAFQRIVAGRAPDGALVHRALRAANPAWPSNPLTPLDRPAPANPHDRDLLAKVQDAWLRWYEQEVFSEPAGATPWVPERMEYRFAVAAPPLPQQSEAVLVAPSYGGELDWHSFDLLAPGTSLGATGAAEVPPPVSLIPSAVDYRGMVSTRFWEFEDASIDLGAVEAQPDDLGRLLLVEFAMVYGDDWFILPLELPTGTLCRVAALDVVDTFGIHRTVAAAAEGDPGCRSRLFRLATPGRDTTSDALLLAPVLGPSLISDPVEQVRFARDEIANVVWGIERVVESASGRPLDLRAAEPALPPSAAVGNAALDYRAMSPLPRNWLPLLPVDPAAPPPRKLTLAAALRDGAITQPVPRGRLVPRDLALADEEVPRDGLEVTRHWRHARWIDGSTWLWSARRRRPSVGEAASALRFDDLASR